MRQNDTKVSFSASGSGRKVIATSKEWPPVPEMNDIRYHGRKAFAVFYVLVFALAKGLVNLSTDDQATEDLLNPIKVSGRCETWPWSNLAGKSKALSRKQDVSTGEHLVLGILESKTYSLLKWEGDVLGIRRGDIHAGDNMVHTFNIVWCSDFLLTFCTRPVVAQSSPLSHHTSGRGAQQQRPKDQEWRMAGPAFVLLKQRELKSVNRLKECWFEEQYFS
ncbi:b1cd5c79-515a-4693-b010-41f765e702ce-CDS [Sclerotinia trifoliorum]|uniref:B1cd5c79-515a-4693-b010-41f765e702ce-CDS n=1 Tax=Sclerotinia trifoliorum TaxID=28548 RepID=A0A8H2ZTG6_9HELO|nr:b1cd5c79-515a-4693-b010-41f765e702ce-CDS [Sclerotinia trifoliorum]